MTEINVQQQEILLGSAAARAVGRASRQAGGGHNIQLMEASAAGRCHFVNTFLDTDKAFLTGT